MTASRRTALVILMAVAAILIAAECLAADTLTVGVVDIGKVYAEAPRIKQLRVQLDRRRQELGARLEIRSQNLMLTEEQIRELVELKMKEKPTDQDKARIKELTDLERANDEELKKLQATAQPTDQEKARLKELTEMQQKAKATGEQIEKDYNVQFQNEANSLEAKAAQEIEEAVKQIAAAKKFQLVFAKDAVLVGGSDLTNDVIAKLDRKPE